MLSTKIREKSVRKMRSMQLLTSILVTAVAVFLAMGGSALAELEDENVSIEWNSSDGDYGIQFSWDSEGFTDMTVSTDDSELVIETDGNIFDQGLSEVAIESVELEEDDLSREEFFNRFPAGTYEFEGTSTEGDTIEGEAELTHDLLEPVVFKKIKLPVIEWIEPTVNDVTGEPLAVVGYVLVVEMEVEIEVDSEVVEREFTETTTYPAGVTKHIVGNRFMKLIKNPPGEIAELKVEIQATEPSGNITATEQEVD